MTDEVASNEDSCQERKKIVETLNELKESRDKEMVVLAEMEKRWVSIQRDVIGLVKGEVASLTDQVQKLMVENIMLKAVNQKWKDQVNELLEKQDSKVDDMKRIVEENKNLTQQLALERNQHKELKSKLEAEWFQLRTERQEFLETLNSTKVEINAAKSNLANAEYLSKEATNRANVLQQDLTSKTTLLQNLKNEMDDMKRIAEENKDLTQQLALERNQLKGMKSKLEAELFQLRTERQECLETLNSTKVEINAAKSNLANAEYLSKEDANRANVLQQDLTSKTTLLENLKSEMDDMKRFAEENKDLTQQLALERNQLKDMKSKLEVELLQLRTERQECLETLNSTKVEINAAKSNLANAEYLSKEATNRANVLQQDLTSKTTLLENLKSEMDDMKRFAEENKDLTQQLALERNQLKDMKSKLEVELLQLRTERQECLETLNSTKVKLNTAKSNLANAEYLSKEATDRAKELQRELDSQTTFLQNLKNDIKNYVEPRYVLGSDKMSWTDSISYCKGKKGNLAAVRSPIDQWLIQNAYDLNSTNGPYWIGRNDQRLNGQHCEGMALGSSTYKTINLDCNFKYIPICEVD
ncbi:hypothetical protein GE061_004809 [Apolygus lucorum]|uniref:C-type lectin domain-containing protein n=1 Tax=Apolygus lucorum TaxID=248454 RepID=A0A6A4KDS1_APOLU|nr:hypothetical protein GE061_004809 [Apolygus lucorum]